MDADQIKLTGMVLAHEHILAALWVGVIRQEGGDPVKICRAIAENNISAIERIYESQAHQLDEGTHVRVQHIISSAENFWKDVETRLSHPPTPQ